MSKVLVVDDELSVSNVFKRALVNAGHDVIVAEDGKIGEQMYLNHRPDIVILDIIMPDQEGIETIIKLKAADNNVKIIAVSGGGMGSANNYLDNQENVLIHIKKVEKD